MTGFEQGAADSLLLMLPGSRLDRAGNVVASRGRGEPLRVAICPLDEPGYVVGGVTPEGYLTLRRVGPSTGPLHDQLWLEARRVTLFGRSGPVEGVVGTRSVHIQPPAAAPQPPFVLHEAFVDVGARSARDVEELGLRLLTPVALAKRLHRYGAGLDRLAAPAASARAACAALLQAALRPASARSSGALLVFARQSRLGHAGESAALRDLAASRAQLRVVVLRAAGEEGVIGGGAFRVGGGAASSAAAPLREWSLPAVHAGSPVETVSLRDVAVLADSLTAFLEAAP